MKKRKYKLKIKNKGWFQKGHIPHNKGKKLSQETKEKVKIATIKAMNALPKYKKDNIKRTQFKKGNYYAHWTGKYAEEHPNYKGIAYRNKALSKKQKKCEKCGKTDFKSLSKLHVHHKDGNRKNNQLSNLKLLCSGCHLNLHKNWEYRQL